MRVSLYTLAAFTLVVLGLARATLLVSHDPALGYGDPSPWHRVAGCVGIEPVPAGLDSAARPRPSASYHTAGFGVGGCYASSGALLAAPVVLGMAIASIASDEPEIRVPLQAFGIFTLAVVGALAIAVTIALRPFPGASIAHAAIFFLLIADPATMLWLNTLHTEPAALLGTYASVAAAAVIALRDDECPVFWWILGAGLAMLGLASSQFALLPVLLALLAAPVLFKRSRRRALAVCGVAAAVAAAQLGLMQIEGDASDRMRSEAHAGLLAGASSDPAATLQRLGLPARCANVSPSAWLVKPADGPSADCPEAGTVGPVALAQLALAEPYTLVRALSRVLISAQSVVPGHLGIAAEGPIASIDDLPPQAMSFLALPSRAPAMAMATAVVALLISFPAALVWLAWTARREARSSAVPLVFSMLVGIGGYALVTATFGEGLFAAQRHDLLGEMGLLAAALLLPWVLWQLTTDLLLARVAMAALLGVILLAAGWALWTQRQPLALGAIEKARASGTALQVVGWALDPWEVRRVYATVGGGAQVDASRGTERRDIAADYPGYPDADEAGFEISIPSNAWRENQELRVFVENRSGAITEIDRRPAATR
ncbi:MAG TPA: hypothetical protein VLT89_16935 [Usitatibacter sp.]|nr:hypothetical protein [Usitatibacter sp.]